MILARHDDALKSSVVRVGFVCYLRRPTDKANDLQMLVGRSVSQLGLLQVVATLKFPRNE